MAGSVWLLEEWDDPFVPPNTVKVFSTLFKALSDQRRNRANFKIDTVSMTDELVPITFESDEWTHRGHAQLRRTEVI